MNAMHFALFPAAAVCCNSAKRSIPSFILMQLQFLRGKNSHSLDAAYAWMDRCLTQDGSILSDGKLWTLPLLQELQTSVVDHPDEGANNFYTKLGGQLNNTSPGAKQLMAELLWALFLFPSNIKPDTKRKGILQIWALSGSNLSDSSPWMADEILQ